MEAKKQMSVSQGLERVEGGENGVCLPNKHEASIWGDENRT